MNECVRRIISNLSLDLAISSQLSALVGSELEPHFLFPAAGDADSGGRSCTATCDINIYRQYVFFVFSSLINLSDASGCLVMDPRYIFFLKSKPAERTSFCP